jgi:hypothetical protein
MKTVYKYQLSFREDVTLLMPKSAVIVAVGCDGIGQPCVWAEVDFNRLHETQQRKFGVYGTGGHVPDFWEYRGTFFAMPYVWHVFEEKPS